MDGTSFLLRGNYQRRPNAIARCASEALKRGYRVMGIQHGGWCASGPRAQLTYAKYGKSSKCKNGKGGPWANDVYRISGEFCLQIIVRGKFETGNRLIELGNFSLERLGHTLHWSEEEMFNTRLGIADFAILMRPNKAKQTVQGCHSSRVIRLCACVWTHHGAGVRVTTPGLKAFFRSNDFRFPNITLLVDNKTAHH